MRIRHSNRAGRNHQNKTTGKHYNHGQTWERDFNKWRPRALKQMDRDLEYKDQAKRIQKETD